MKNNPLISVIIPAYNVEDYIARGIESVLNQTYQELEVVIVDDGSKDNTVKVIKEYEKKDKRVKLFLKDNGGVSSARNLALEKSEGEYVIFLDSDDWIEKHTLQHLLNMSDDENMYLVSGDCFFAYLNDNGSIRKEKHREKHIKVKMTKKEAILTTGTGEYNLQSSCYKLYSKKIINENNIKFREDIAHGEDGLFVFKYLNCVDGLIYENEPLWNILERPNSATTAPYNKKWLSAIDAVDEMISYAETDIELGSAIKKFYVQRTIMVFMACIRNSRSEKSDKKYLRIKLKKYKKEYLNSDISMHDRLVYYMLLKCPLSILKYIV